MKIQELDWSAVPDAAVLIFIGRRKSGKTVNIIDTFYKKRNSFKMGIVFCGSKATVKDYENHIPSSFIYYGYHSDVLGAIINKQEKDVELGVAKPIFVLVDDCMWAKQSILKDPNIRRVFMNGRHALIFFCLSMQYCMDLHPALRQQIDFTFLSREKNPQNRDRLFKNYNVCFKDDKQFDSTMMQCTLNHETFVLNNGSSDSDRPEDNVFWWKSKFVPGGRKFRVNKHGTWWKFHKKRFNPMHFLPANEQKSKDVVVKKVQHTAGRKRRLKQKPGMPHSPPGRKPTNLQHALASTQTDSAAAWLRKQRNQNLGPRQSSGFSAHAPNPGKRSSREIDVGVRFIN